MAKLDPTFFQSQIEKLAGSFPGKHFDQARVGLIWGECHDLSNNEFEKICLNFIRERPPTKPPLPADFRESARLERKAAFQSDVYGAADAMNRSWQNGLRSFLNKNYPGAKTINQAVEIEIEKNRIAKALGGK